MIRLKKVFSYTAAAFLCISLAFLMLAGNAQAEANAKTYFGSESYAASAGESFRVGVYLESDRQIGAYRICVSYDDSRLRYIDGGDYEEDGTIVLEGTGYDTALHYMLSFEAISGGDAGIMISEAEAWVSEAAGGEEMTLAGFPAARISISGQDTSGNDAFSLTAEEDDAKVFYLEDYPEIPLLGRVFDGDTVYYIADLSSWQPEALQDGNSLTAETADGLALTVIRCEETGEEYLWLMNENGEYVLYSFDSENGEMLPADPAVLNGTEDIGETVTSEKIAESITQQESTETAVSDAAVQNEIKYTETKQESGKKEQFLLICVLIGGVLIAGITALIFLLRIRREKRRLKQSGQEDASAQESPNTDSRHNQETDWEKNGIIHEIEFPDEEDERPSVSANEAEEYERINVSEQDNEISDDVKKSLQAESMDVQLDDLMEWNLTKADDAKKKHGNISTDEMDDLFFDIANSNKKTQ